MNSVSTATKGWSAKARQRSCRSPVWVMRRMRPECGPEPPTSTLQSVARVLRRPGSRFWSCAGMKRAILVLALLFVAAPAHAQGSGPILSPAVREEAVRAVRAGGSCASCDLFQADLSYLDISRRNFAASRLRQADLQLVTADRAHFRGANLSIANLFGGRFGNADF